MINSWSSLNRIHGMAATIARSSVSVMGGERTLLDVFLDEGSLLGEATLVSERLGAKASRINKRWYMHKKHTCIRKNGKFM